MQHFFGLHDVSYKDAWLTIGAFDGFHIGHQKIVKKLTAGAHAKGVPAVVLTFYPHPSRVIFGPTESFYLTMPDRKAYLLGEAGVDAVITYPFDAQTASISAEDFIDKLCRHLNFTQLWIGYDFALGHNREGDTQLLKEIGSKYGYELNAIEAFQHSGEIISSTRIRGLLKDGQVSEAAELLGRPHSVTGIVTKGDGRGKMIGIPTANPATHKSLIVPKEGVYACEALFDKKKYQAVTNVGRRPTFELEPVPSRVETHILDFDQEIYGRAIRVDFIEHLRDEQKFTNSSELVKQIGVDIQHARKVFNQ